ncbi:MAG: ATP synthase F1 subunit epsilon [Peptoniphilus sp.]|nr:ATP synthase F1 subunit epsilon [Peptoniphilus sp.]MDD7363224.1 ATP synthase F1 subunit epsilon [Bacillota bacterium]MDY6044452.1 ATP synthase F1 subunit epsilon [Peptoniphilus sp.]
MITLRLVTPYADGFEREVDRVIVRGVLGDMMLMENTAPIVTPLDYGLIRIFEGGEEKQATIHSGYMSMKENVCTVATRAFEWIDEIDVERAEEAKRRAEEKLAELENDDDGHEEIEAQLSLLRALNRLRHAKYR